MLCRIHSARGCGGHGKGAVVGVEVSRLPGERILIATFDGTVTGSDIRACADAVRALLDDADAHARAVLVAYLLDDASIRRDMLDHIDTWQLDGALADARLRVLVVGEDVMLWGVLAVLAQHPSRPRRTPRHATLGLALDDARRWVRRRG